MLLEDLRNCMRVFYDDSGAAGRRYRRQDECGTPYCITVNSETLTNNSSQSATRWHRKESTRTTLWNI